MKINASWVRQRCPKCGGNLFLYEYHGWYEQCLQCSFTQYLDVTYEDRTKADQSETFEVSHGTPPRV